MVLGPLRVEGSIVGGVYKIEHAAGSNMAFSWVVCYHELALVYVTQCHCPYNQPVEEVEVWKQENLQQV